MVAFSSCNLQSVGNNVMVGDHYTFLVQESVTITWENKLDLQVGPTSR
jgi:hypothetical protein